MPQIKIIYQTTQSTGNIVDTAYGDPVSLDGALTFSAQCAVDENTPSSKTFDSGAANVSDVQTVADTGVKEVSDITCVADTGILEIANITTVADVGAFEIADITTVADVGAFEIADITTVADAGVKEVSQALTNPDAGGSLNSAYFTAQAIEADQVTTLAYYVWYNVNGAGVDPMAPGLGIEVAIATDATANTIATATRSAINASAANAYVLASGSTNVVTITNLFTGNVTNIADGAAATGFAFSTPTPGVNSNLLNSYFTFSFLSSGGVATNYYAWFNVNSQGVDPAIGGKTAIPVAIAASAADTVVASALRTALGAVSALAAVSGSTTHAILTAVFVGNPTSAADGSPATGFNFSITNGVASNLLNSYFTFSFLNTSGSATNYYAWFNVNSQGVDPAIADTTGIEVAIAAAATASAVASALRTALGAVSALAAVTGATTHAILTAVFVGNPTSATDGSPATGFNFSITNGVASNLNSSYFTFSFLSATGVATNYYVWFSVNSQGVNPAPGGTAIAVTLAASAADTAVASALRTALSVVSLAAVSGATTHAILTAINFGNPTSATDGSPATGFNFSITNGAVSNLNSSYFNYQTENLAGASQNNRYIWYNVNSQGIDPAPAGRTGIQVALAVGSIDTVVGSSTRSALGGDTRIAVTGSGAHAIITNNYMGNVVNAANGTASPGFSYSITPGAASNLNNSYFTFSDTLNVTNYYAWFNINSEGTDPALPGKTAIAVTGVASVTANNIASAARTAIDAITTTDVVVSGSTNHIILTNATRNTCTATANGVVSPGFTISNSPVGAPTEVSTVDDDVTIPTHGYITGVVGQLTSTGTLPAGLSLATDYYTIPVDVNTLAFAATLADAENDVRVDITGLGSNGAVNTFTPGSLGSASVQLQISNSNPVSAIWSNLGSATTITADSTLFLEKINPTGTWMRLAYLLDSGEMSINSVIVVKGPN